MTNATQKTWTDLFGPITDVDIVLGKEFIRNLGEDRYRILWTFDDPTTAWECFKAWQSGR